MLTRRGFLGATLAAPLVRCLRQDPQPALPPVRALTRGPKFHWFGYYDKLEFDPTDRFVLGMQVDFEHRSPRPNDVIGIGMVDLDDGDAWIELGESRAWCWQQGCMLQWRPGSTTEVVWNDREQDRFVCRILDVKTRAQRTIDHPIYTLSPDGRSALTLDFARVQDMRPGYGYAGLRDVHRDVAAPEDSGIFRVDLQTGARELVVPLAAVADAVPGEARHYFNHLLFSPDGARFVFLHRWRPRGGGGFRTRMLTAAPDGSDRRVVDASGHTSHFIWRDSSHLLAWTRREEAGDAFYLFEDGEESEVEVVGRGVMTRNGHCTYLPGNAWILNDTYPDAEGLQHPYLFHVASERIVPLGHFASPKVYRGEGRCDTHPRASRDGRRVVIDSPHGGGRQLYLIDVSGLV